MVEIVEEKREFEKDTISSKNFLTSLRDFQSDGVEMGVERVSKPFINKQNPSKVNLAVNMSILGDMPKCRVFVLENNEYVTKVNEMTGNVERELDIEDVSGRQVTFYLALSKQNKNEELDDDCQVVVYKSASSYPLIKAGFVENGDIPKDTTANIRCTIGEIRDVLEGMTFIGTCEKIDGNFTYNRLAVELI